MHVSHNRFAFHSKIHKSNIQLNHKKKKNMRDPQINSKGSTKLFLDFFYIKKAMFG
jgi:hypothetical protein